MKFKKLTAVIAVITVAALLAAGCGSKEEKAGDKPGKTIIATQDLLSTSVIAKGQDYFQETMGEGAEIKRFGAGRDINNALMSGSAEFGMLGVCPTAVGLTTGAEYKVIWTECLIRGTEGLAVRKGSGINRVKDLKGKKVGVTVASSGHYGLLCALEDAGMTAKDIELVDLDPDAINSAWARGDIDAAYTWNPTLINLKNQDGTVLLTGADLAKKGHPTMNFHVVRTEFAEKNPKVVKAYCAALAKGAELYDKDKKQAYDIVSKYLEMTPEQAKEQMTDEYVKLEDQMELLDKGTAAETIYNVAKFLEKEDQIQDGKDLQFFKDAIDTSYVKALLEESK